MLLSGSNYAQTDSNKHLEQGNLELGYVTNVSQYNYHYLPRKFKKNRMQLCFF